MSAGRCARAGHPHARLVPPTPARGNPGRIWSRTAGRMSAGALGALCKRPGRVAAGMRRVRPERPQGPGRRLQPAPWRAPAFPPSARAAISAPRPPLALARPARPSPWPAGARAAGLLPSRAVAAAAAAAACNCWTRVGVRGKRQDEVRRTPLRAHHSRVEEAIHPV